MFKTFKAKIHDCFALVPFTSEGVTPTTFLFTKTKIKYIHNKPNVTYKVGRDSDDRKIVADGASYTLSKVFNERSEKEMLLIEINNSMKAYLDVKGLERLKCLWLHKMTRYHKHKDWFWKLVIGTIFVALVGLVFKQGCNNQSEDKKNADNQTKNTAQ